MFVSISGRSFSLKSKYDILSQIKANTDNYVVANYCANKKSLNDLLLAFNELSCLTNIPNALPFRLPLSPHCSGIVSVEKKRDSHVILWNTIYLPKGKMGGGGRAVGEGD